MEKEFQKKTGIKKKSPRVDFPFWPHHFMKEMIVAILMITLLVSLATFLPAPAGSKADPYSPPERVKPQWYFLAPYLFLKGVYQLSFLGTLIPKLAGFAGIFGLLFIITALPFLDKSGERDPGKRIRSLVLASLILLLLVLLTLLGLIL